jgi:hypothetical protein
MPLWGKTDSSESMPKSVDGVAIPDNILFQDMESIFKDERPGIKDPSERAGWYFKNSVAGHKINWYFYDGNEGITLGDFAAYAVVTMDSVTSAPFITVYTKPQASGNAGSWYRSRMVFVVPSGAATAGTKYLLTFGVVPEEIHPELPRIALISSGSSNGPRLPDEEILTSGIGSNSSASVNTCEFVCESLGMVSSVKTIEYMLKIREDYITEVEVETGVPVGKAAEVYMVDIEEAEIAKTKGVSGPGWWTYKTWTTSTGKVRHKAECLVALKVSKSEAGDRQDDDIFPDEE